MVGRVGEVDSAGEFRTESGESSVVGDIAGREYECSRLAVESRDFLLQVEMPRSVTGNVTGAAGTVTIFIERAARSRHVRM